MKLVVGWFSKDGYHHLSHSTGWEIHPLIKIEDLGERVIAPLDSPGRLDYECATTRTMDATKLYFLIFGALTIVGGVVGYVKAGSLPSIIAGAITGVLLLVAGALLPEHRAAGLATAFVISLLLAAQFVPKFIRTGKVMPAGLMSILSVIGLVVAIVAWLKK
jgi:uncharacterized membrane protein (UPF0136 family)